MIQSIKRRSILGMIGAGVLPHSGLAQSSSVPMIRILSYNIHIGIGLDKLLQLERIAALIREQQPDLVALQEVDRNAERSQRMDQPAELARLTGMQVVFGRTLFHGSSAEAGEYGNAILSRFPISTSQNHELPAAPGVEPRCALEVRLEWPNAGGEPLPIRFIATHFDHTSEANRIAAAETLNALAEADPELPTFLAGDLNGTPDTEPMRILRQRWKLAGWPDLHLSFPADAPTRQIDYILYRPAESWSPVDVHIVDEAVASDHRPILASLRRS